MTVTLFVCLVFPLTLGACAPEYEILIGNGTRKLLDRRHCAL